MRGRMLMGTAAMLFMLGPAPQLGWASDGHSLARSFAIGHDSGHGYHDGYGHESTGHFLRHLLAHRKEIGLTEDQVRKLKALQLDLTRQRYRAEAEIEVTEIELTYLLEDDKATLAAIEAKVTLSEDLEKSLRMAAIKTRRDALGVLTPAQRAKEQAEHEQMRQQMDGGSPHHTGHGAPSA
jgi:protein CpxP